MKTRHEHNTHTHTQSPINVHSIVYADEHPQGFSIRYNTPAPEWNSILFHIALAARAREERKYHYDCFMKCWLRPEMTVTMRIMPARQHTHTHARTSRQKTHGDGISISIYWFETIPSYSWGLHVYELAPCEWGARDWVKGNGCVCFCLYHKIQNWNRNRCVFPPFIGV